MQKSKILALLLAVAMVASMVVVPAYATGEYTMTLAADKATVAPGGTVTLTLSVENNPGIMSVGAVIGYADGWTAGAATAFANATFTDEDPYFFVNFSKDEAANNRYVAHFAGVAENNGPIHGSGDLIAVTFTAPTTVGTYTFTLSGVKDGLNLNTVDDNGTSAGITLGNTEVEITVSDTACAKCGAVAEWTEWTGGAFEAGKHYYMTDDVELSARVGANVDFCLDLCGHTITGPTTGQIFRLYGGANIAFMSSGGRGTIQANGTYTASDAGGGAIYANANLSLYNITVTDGNCGTMNGGNIYILSGRTVYMEDCVISDGQAYSGGNIYAAGSATVEITGNTEISGGMASYRGGNIAASGTSSTTRATVKISGNSVISGGTATNWNVAKGVWGHQFADITVSGDADVANFLMASGTTLKMYGGTIGNLQVRAGSTTNVYGGIVNTLSGNTSANFHNAYLGEVTETASANVSSCAAVTNVGTTGKLVAHAAGTCTTCGHTYSEEGANTTCTICSAVHTAWAGAALPWDGGDIDSGSYKLTRDMTVESTDISGNLDLNGHTLTVTDTLNASAAGNIIDSKGTGKLVGENVTFNDENTMLPIATDDGYVFEKPVFAQRLTEYTQGSGTAKYAFYLENTADTTVMDTALASGDITIQVKVTWNGGEKTFALDSTMEALDVYAANWDDKMLILNLTGLEGITGLQCTAQVYANGVTVE